MALPWVVNDGLSGDIYFGKQTAPSDHIMSLVWTAKPAEEGVLRAARSGRSMAADHKAALALWSPYIQVFLYLQVLDLLTTLIGLKLGIAEASPFVRSLLQFGPGLAVTASKLVAIGLAALCFTLKRSRLIVWVNCWYGLIVVWNLCTILTV
jgi:hypothetical protein